MSPASKPVERTLKEMLRAAQVLDGSAVSVNFRLREALEKVVRRAAEVARALTCYTDHDIGHMARYAAYREILADAGLDEEEQGD